MHTGRPAASHFLLHDAARKVQPGLVEKSELFVKTSDPDHDRCCVGHVAETLLAFAELCFSLLAFCDILSDPHHANRFACVVDKDSSLGMHPAYARIKLHDAVLPLPLVASLEALVREHHDPFSVIQIYKREPIGLGERIAVIQLPYREEN